ncbi:hypothetical protein ABZ942_25640 [Nocardia sp. NPDC046473]|uniref:hypothetical protein n=1 Tax=Nocardia sp. NPDC046473 TaxID=3155733 RepID=UPI0033CC8776
MYRVETDPDVHQQIAALPAAALGPFAELMVTLEVSPWSGDSINRAKSEAPVRTMAFGANHEGLITYLVVDERREVHVLIVQWVGD